MSQGRRPAHSPQGACGSPICFFSAARFAGVSAYTPMQSLTHFVVQPCGNSSTITFAPTRSNNRQQPCRFTVLAGVPFHTADTLITLRSPFAEVTVPAITADASLTSWAIVGGLQPRHASASRIPSVAITRHAITQIDLIHML